MRGETTTESPWGRRRKPARSRTWWRCPMAARITTRSGVWARCSRGWRGSAGALHTASLVSNLLGQCPCNVVLGGQDVESELWCRGAVGGLDHAGWRGFGHQGLDHDFMERQDGLGVVCVDAIREDDSDLDRLVIRTGLQPVPEVTLGLERKENVLVDRGYVDLACLRRRFFAGACPDDVPTVVVPDIRPHGETDRSLGLRRLPEGIQGISVVFGCCEVRIGHVTGLCLAHDDDESRTRVDQVSVSVGVRVGVGIGIRVGVGIGIRVVIGVGVPVCLVCRCASAPIPVGSDCAIMACVLHRIEVLRSGERTSSPRSRSPVAPGVSDLHPWF
jgi:hypothetical protein